MSAESIPEKIKIARDVDLINYKEVSFVSIITIEKMNHDNWKDIIAFEPTTFKEAANHYTCDICKQKCREKNMIYTNKKYAGVDICTNCIEKAFICGLEQITPSFPGSRVYSLKNILRCVIKRYH